MNFKNKISFANSSEVPKEVQLQGQIDWKIKNFLDVGEIKFETDGTVKDPNVRTQNKEFNFPEVKKTYNFYIAILSRPDKSNPDERNFGVFLINNNEETLDMEVEYSLVVKKKSQHTLEGEWQFRPHKSAGSYQYLSKKEVKQFLTKRGSLHIRCKFTILKSNVISDKKESCQQSMAKLLTGAKYSDFKIICEDRTFDCHKNMLANKSDIFETMFDENWKECNTNSVTIKHFRSQTIEQMLLYIYTNQIQFSKETDLTELILIADMYNIKGLFDVCQVEMSKQMNVDNVVDIIDVASKVGATRLKKIGIDFAIGKGRSVTGTDRWKETVEKNPEILEELSSIEAMKKKKNSGSKLLKFFRRWSYYNYHQLEYFHIFLYVI